MTIEIPVWLLWTLLGLTGGSILVIILFFAFVGWVALTTFGSLRIF